MEAAPTFAIEVPQATTRRCTRCGEVRPIEMFYLEIERRRAAREGRRLWHSPCRFCQREINTARRKPRQDYADAIKMKKGCADCGIKSDYPEIYDFDHLPGVEKVMTVSRRLTNGPWQDFVDEIAKCEVVCSNCHRIRTRARGHNNFGNSKPDY